MNATIKIQTITPTHAALMLEDLYPMQRKIKPTAIEQLEREMRQGTFGLSTDAILLINGSLGNGQHRLRAVVQSGKPQKFLVLETNDESIFKFIDCGKSRTVGDTMQLHNALTVTAAARWILTIRKGNATPLSGISNTNVTRSEIIQFIQLNNESLQALHASVYALYIKSKLLAPSLCLAFLWNAAQNGERTAHQAAKLLHQVFTGQECDGPANDLRNRLISNMGSRSKLPSGYLMGLLVKTFRAVSEGKNTLALRFVESEKMPEMPSWDE